MFLCIGIFSKCNLGRAIKNNLFDTPGSTVLPNSQIEVPYVFLGDEAFPILENLLKPYPRNQSLHDRSKAVFNYRLSRARRIVENAFGIMSHSFRILFTPIHLNVDILEDLITVTCILHNLMIDERGTQEETSDLPPSHWESIDEHHEIDNEIDSNPNEEMKYVVRNRYKEYFNTIGSVPWQNETFRL